MNETTSIGVRLPKKVIEYIDREAEKKSVDRSVIIRRLIEKGIAELEKEKAARAYVEGKISISGASQAANITVPEMVDYLVCKGYKSEYSIDDFKRGTALLEKKLKT